MTLAEAVAQALPCANPMGKCNATVKGLHHVSCPAFYRDAVVTAVEEHVGALRERAERLDDLVDALREEVVRHERRAERAEADHAMASDMAAMYHGQRDRAEAEVARLREALEHAETFLARLVDEHIALRIGPSATLEVIRAALAPKPPS